MADAGDRKVGQLRYLALPGAQKDFVVPVRERHATLRRRATPSLVSGTVDVRMMSPPRSTVPATRKG
jgi:hypothetical protein